MDALSVRYFKPFSLSSSLCFTLFIINTFQNKHFQLVRFPLSGSTSSIQNYLTHSCKPSCFHTLKVITDASNNIFHTWTQKKNSRFYFLLSISSLSKLESVLFLSHLSFRIYSLKLLINPVKVYLYCFVLLLFRYFWLLESWWKISNF